MQPSRTLDSQNNLEGEKKKLWFFIFPLKHKLLSKEIFKSQKLLRSEPKLEAAALAQDTSGDAGF